MKHLFQELESIDLSQKSRITNERQFILSQFVEEINKERMTGKYKPITGRMIAIKLGHLKDNATLNFFLNQCKKYKLENKSHSFSKCFFGALKVKKQTPPFK